MSIKPLMLIAMLSLMLGCANIPVPPTDVGCILFRPIDTNEADLKVIPRAVKLQIAQHNEAWDKKCGVLRDEKGA